MSDNFKFIVAMGAMGAFGLFCWAWAEQDGTHAARPCTAYPPNSWSPEVYVRALLDTENKRLFAYIN